LFSKGGGLAILICLLSDLSPDRFPVDRWTRDIFFPVAGKKKIDAIAGDRV
jgi:hypothetical protein